MGWWEYWFAPKTQELPDDWRQKEARENNPRADSGWNYSLYSMPTLPYLDERNTNVDECLLHIDDLKIIIRDLVEINTQLKASITTKDNH